MGNMFSCCSNAIRFPKVDHLEEVISFIETPLDAIFIDKPKESTFEAEITNISAGVASSINYGSCFLENVAGRVKRHSSKIDIQKVVSGTLRGAEQVHWVGAAISVVAYVLDQTDKSSPLSSRKECVEVLRFMCGVVKHIQQRIKRLPEEKLNDLVAFIVKGSFFCMSQMQSTSLSSYFSGLVDGVEINSLQAKLITNYEELEPYPDEDDKQKIFDWPKDVVTSNLSELISYIEKYLAKLDKAEEITSESDGIASGRVASSIEYGKHLLRRVWKRCQRHGFKSGETIKVVIDVLKEASQIQWVGAGLTVVAYVLQKVDDASTIKEECVDFLKHMCHLATHIKGLDGQIPQEKLHDVAEFIFEGSFFCLSRIQSSNLSRIFSSVVDSEEMKKLQSKLGQNHQDLTLEALIEALHRMPKALPFSQGEKNLNAVGIDESVLELTKMLAMDDKQDVSSRAVVVYGVGGMGKTCLGNEVFSCLDLKGFKYCHLIIKQDCSEDDLQKLQKQILSDLFGQNSNLRDSDEGHREICKVFREKAREPLFMFIDNALKGSDLAKILPDDLSTMPKRSRMLVTTRKLDETDMLNKPDVITRVAYPINCLPPNEAKKLLSTKALGIPLGTFDASSDIDGLLSACGGIPLVLNLVGTRLCKHRNNLSAFNSTIETFRDSLEKGEDESTEKVVDVVFKSLPGDRYKDAFLDIAAFFSSCEKDIVSNIVGKDELLALEEAALVKISDDNVELHDVILNRGRKLSESDRITDLISLADIIEDTERLEKLKGIRLIAEFHLQAKHLDKMHNCLRVLILGQNEVTGACSREFKNLRYLSIDNENCCSPMELNKLPRLAIFNDRIRSDDCFCNAPPSLRSLSVYGLESVWLDGSFDKLSHLEELSICRKENYVKRLPESFGELRFLRCLHLYHFTELNSLPNTFGQLSTLKELTIWDCPKLSSLSDDFGHLKSLESLTIGVCRSLVKLSDTFALLNNLKKLTIWDCSSLSSLPNKFGHLKSLQFLEIYHCKSLSSLCEDFGHLRSLESLTIRFCRSLVKLSDTFAQLNNLKELTIWACSSLSSLPNKFGQLKSLQFLEIFDCESLSSLCEDFGHLRSLESLTIQECESLERFNDTFGQLSSLKELITEDSTMLCSLRPLVS